MKAPSYSFVSETTRNANTYCMGPRTNAFWPAYCPDDFTSQAGTLLSDTFVLDDFNETMRPIKNENGIRDAVLYTNQALESSYESQAYWGGHEGQPPHSTKLCTSRGLKRRAEDPSEFQTTKRIRAKGNLDDSNALADESDSGSQPWACPFFRHDPLGNMDCLKLKLKRIRDVKQHIQRRHNKSGNFCPKCFQNFASQKEKEKHLNMDECERIDQSASLSAGVLSKEAQDKLKRRAPRTKSGDEQWRDVYNILFSEQKGPDVNNLEPQLGTCILETTRLMMSFWKNENDWLPGYLGGQPQAQSMSQENLQVLVIELMGEIQKRFEDRIQGGIITTEGGSNSSSTLDPPSRLSLPTIEAIPGNDLQHEISDPGEAILGSYISPEFGVNMDDLFHMPS